MTSNRRQKGSQAFISHYKHFPKQLSLHYNFVDLTFIIHQGIEISGRFKICRLVYVKKIYMFDGLILSGNTEQFADNINDILVQTFSNYEHHLTLLPTLLGTFFLSTYQAAPGVLCPVLAPTSLERHGQTGEGPKEDHGDDQRTL